MKKIDRPAPPLILCECGCGEAAPIAKKTDNSRGYVEGMPRRFIRQHQNRMPEFRRKGMGFWNYVNKNAPNGCWVWTGGIGNRDGYGVHIDRYAHVVSFEEACGSVPLGLEIDHLCNNRACVNPAHLEAVTHAENCRRAAERRVSCKNGHLWSENEFRYNGDTKRSCRTCVNERHERRYQANKAARIAAGLRINKRIKRPDKRKHLLGDGL